MYQHNNNNTATDLSEAEWYREAQIKVYTRWAVNDVEKIYGGGNVVMVAEKLKLWL